MYYQKHIFYCTNQREHKKACGQCAAAEMAAYTKKQLQLKELYGKHKIRVSTSGCLGRCEEGPICVVYPDGIWYTYQSQQDIDEIIQQHLIEGKVVERLVLKEITS